MSNNFSRKKEIREKSLKKRKTYQLKIANRTFRLKRFEITRKFRTKIFLNRIEIDKHVYIRSGR